MSYLYAVQMIIPDYFFSPVKIGFSTDPEKREQSYACGPFPVQWLGVWSGTRADEQDMHERYAARRLKGEWFIPSEEMLEEISNAISMENFFDSADALVEENRLEGETEYETRERLFGDEAVRAHVASREQETAL